MKKMFALIIILILAQPSLVSAAEYIDLPPCQALTADDGQYRLGLMTPLNNPDLAARSYELSLFYQDLSLCQIGWDDILPLWQPQSPIPELERYYGYAVYGACFIISLMLFALLPSSWTRHLTLLGLLVIAVMTYTLATAGLFLAKQFELPQKLLYQHVVFLQKSGKAAQWLNIEGVWDLDTYLTQSGLKPDFRLTHLNRKNSAETSANDSVQQELTGNLRLSKQGLMIELKETDKHRATRHIWLPAQDFSDNSLDDNPQGKQFKVHNSLNIRQQPGIQSPRLTSSPLHRGAVVEVIAPPQGDWWKVKVLTTGEQGWVSSLWLRSLEDFDE